MEPGRPPRVFWPEDLLQKHGVSNETALFLRTVGLPESIPGTTVEFGIFDSSGEELVIGQDFENPILVDRDSGAVYEEDAAGDGNWFINSSVQMLDRFIEEIFFTEGTSPDWLEEVGERLLKLDPAALDATRRCVWPVVLQTLEGL